MKTSLRKLRGFALHRHGATVRKHARLLGRPDELVQASQDMQDMKDCYDNLLSAAAATANSAYEFSESLREMGACLLEKTALNDDEESGKVLLLLGKVQFEIQRLVDIYRSHIFKTITVPSESLLNELRTVEEMKRQCDDKRDAYEYMITKQREKRKSRGWKDEAFSSQELQAAQNDYDEEATLFVFRLNSLKQGQSRTLLTQAARHHAAQLCFFRKALKSLEGIEPHVKSITEQQHIDYHVNGSEDDMEDDDDDADDDSDNGSDELSFDYGQNDQPVVVSTPRGLMELDGVDPTFPQAAATMEPSEQNLDKKPPDPIELGGEFKASSQSAPLFAENKFDLGERIGQIGPSSTHKLRTYALPTPHGVSRSISAGTSDFISNTGHVDMNSHVQNLWHSSPLGQRKFEKVSGDEKLSKSDISYSQSVLKESNSNNTASGLLRPPPAGGLSFQWSASDTKKLKRDSFSGPLTSKPMSTKPLVTVTGPSNRMEKSPLFSSPLPKNPRPHRASTDMPPAPLFLPKISELHELPRPPVSSNTKYARPLGFVGHSAPLAPRGRGLSVATNKVMPSAASPLPRPPLNLHRSFSIPSNGLREAELHFPKSSEVSHSSEMAEDAASPPLTPFFLQDHQSASAAVAVSHDVQIKGEAG